MVHVHDLLERDLPQPELQGVPTGFVDLDDVLGGLKAGRVLLVATSPGQGKTTYAVQMAAAAAMNDRRVQLQCPRETDRAVAARVLASTARTSYHHLLTGRLLDRDARGRVREVRDQFQATHFDVTAGSPIDVAEVADCDLLVIDDVHLGAPDVRDGLIRAARAGAVVVATIPLDLLVCGPVGPGAEVDRTWADVCDYAVAFVWPSPLDADRAGEADLFLIKNRHGPTLHEVVAFQGGYARYKNFSADPVPDTTPCW